MLPYRQVHLDFHTSEHMPGVGSRFSRENFAEALRVGRVNSITLFAKCHHGWAYYPATVGTTHPTLEFDLLGAQLDVCRELGVRTEVYVSAGFDEKYARAHVDCLRTNRDGSYGSFLRAGYHRLCFGSPYLDHLAAEVEEVLRHCGDRVEALFLDIVGIGPCSCPHCIVGMREAGLDPSNEADARDYARAVYLRYTARMAEVVDRVRPGLAIIHNDGGAIFQGREIAYRNRGHFELESLPTGGWGYDHFPRAAAYARVLGREFVGMTGKFNRSWGEFGGFKHPNALRYEAALANVCGARCSVGDQLHPDGEMDLATYRMIGAAYAEVEAREPYLGGVSVADVGLIAAETCGCRLPDGSLRQDIGANRMMLELHYLYDVIDFDTDFAQYKLLILPDNITLDNTRKAKLDVYLAQGGKLLLSGRSGLGEAGNFALDCGLHFGGASEFKPSYLRPRGFLWPNGQTDYVVYAEQFAVTADENWTGQVLADRVDPYFNRTAAHFCSHRHTPYDRAKTSPSVYLGEQIGYIGFDVFTEYANQGASWLRSLVKQLCDALLGAEGKTLDTDLPSCGVTSLWRDGERTVQRIAYAIPKVRGNGIEVIEDLPTVTKVMTLVRHGRSPKRVYLAPEGKDLPFTYYPESGVVEYTIDAICCAETVVIE